MSITQLEDLSNEILYEIFEYFDACLIHNIFSNLNNRFEYLLKYSSLPMKFNISWTSKSTFEHDCQHLIAPNVNRILSLNILNSSAIKIFLTLFPMNNSFNRLESLNFSKMDSEQIIPFLTCLQSLPRLFSLSITIDNIDVIYPLITILPVLKYCKITFETYQPIVLRKSEQQESTIEHLIVNGTCQLNQLDTMLSYTPRLTHLSCHSLEIGKKYVSKPAIIVKLKKLYLNLGSIPFHFFRLFICKISSQLEILRISASIQKAYLDANQWEELISYHLPNLRIFDIQFKSELTKSMEYDQLIKQFQSNFWLERNWFFVYQNCQGYSGVFKFFYSIHPYRRKYYRLYEHDLISPYQDSSVHLCRHVIIENRWMNTDCSIRFPYATKLTLTGDYAAEISSLISNLTSIISLKQITELVLDYEFLFMDKLLMLLQYMPNIDSLIIPQLALVRTYSSSENDRKLISIVSKTNRITKVIIKHTECTIVQLRFLFNLCPYIEYLSIDLPNGDERSILRFLISQMKKNNSHLFFLCLNHRYANTELLERIRSMINNENLLENYSLDLFEGNISLWC